jgi:hypothetical protein
VSRHQRKIEISCRITNACSLALLLVKRMLGCTALLVAQVTAQESTQSAATNNPRRDMIQSAWERRAPTSSLGEEARVFDRFVGTWECDFANFDDDGKVKRAKGEVIFGGIIDGRAVQDVWTWLPNGRGGNERGIGTTVRIFDAKLKKWCVVWVSAEAGVIQTLVGGAVGDRIVLDGTGDDGSLLRWSFNDIRSDSFVWRGEKSRDGGKTWRLTGEYQMRRRNTSALVDSESKSLQTKRARISSVPASESGLPVPIDSPSCEVFQVFKLAIRKRMLERLIAAFRDQLGNAFSAAATVSDMDAELIFYICPNWADLRAPKEDSIRSPTPG